MTLDHIRRAPGCLRTSMVTLALSAMLTRPLAAQDAGKSWSDLATAETEANSGPGPRQAPARGFPVPAHEGKLTKSTTRDNRFYRAWGGGRRGGPLIARRWRANRPRQAQLLQPWNPVPCCPP